MQVLLADASKAVRAITRGMLAGSRFDGDLLLEAESPDHVASWLDLRTPGPALIVADWDLPDLDGFALLAELQDAGASGHVSVVFCVNHAQVPMAEEAVRRGACGYVVRPFTAEQLVEKLEAGAAAARTTPPSDVLRDIVTSVRSRQGLPSLMSLPSAAIAEVFRRGNHVRHAAGETIVWRKQGVSTLSFITAGQVEVFNQDGSGTVRGPGDCFAERAFVCGEPSKVEVKALSAVELVRLPKDLMVELARRYPEVRTLLTELLSKAGTPPAAETEICGAFESLPFADLVQFLNASRKTGILRIEGEARGVVYFSAGEAHDARVGNLSGEDAFFAMSDWKRARFEFRGGGGTGERTLERPTLRLLFEADARRTTAVAG